MTQRKSPSGQLSDNSIEAVRDVDECRHLSRKPSVVRISQLGFYNLTRDYWNPEVDANPDNGDSILVVIDDESGDAYIQDNVGGGGSGNPPIVDMLTPSNSSRYWSGPVTYTFRCSYSSNVAASNCVPIIDGEATSDVVTIIDNSNPTSVIGSITPTLAEGTHTLAVRCTFGTNSATATARTVVITDTPTIAIVTPSNNATVDVAPLIMAGTCSEPLEDGTVVTIKDSDTVLGTTTLLSASWNYTTPTLLEGSHSLTASISPPEGYVVSVGKTVNVIDALPVAVSITPSGSTLPAGPIAVTLTGTHLYGRALLARARIDSGEYFDLTLTDVNTYSGNSPPISTDGSHNVVGELTDAISWDAGALSSVTAAFSVSYAVPWNGGVQSFNAAYRDAIAPSSGALLLDLSAAASDAVNGSVLRVTVPAGCTAFGLRLPTGYRVASDASIAWVDTTTLDGYEPWVPGIPYTIYYQVDTGNKLVKISARKDLATTIGASARLYRCASVGAIDTAARLVTGDTSTETATNSVCNAIASCTYSGGVYTSTTTTRFSDFGTVLHNNGAGSGFQVPIAGSSAAWSQMGWVLFATNAQSAICVCPNVADMTSGTVGKAGGIFLAASQTLMFAGGITAPAEYILANDAANPWGIMLDKPNHVAFVCDSQTLKFYLNGRLISTSTIASSSWGADITNGNGARLGNLGGIWNSVQSWYKNWTFGAYVATVAQIGAHMSATSPVSVAQAHVLTLGSSLQQYTPTGGTKMTEVARLAAGANTNYWHNYAVSGAPVDKYANSLIPLQGQGNRACSDWHSRGTIAVLDWGNVINQGNSTLALCRESMAAMVAESKILLNRGCRLVMLDMAAKFDATVGGTENGANLRLVQEEYCDQLGNSVIRLPTREILGPTWADQVAWYDTSDVHFNKQATDLIGAALGALVAALRSQPIPLQSPSWL